MTRHRLDANHHLLREVAEKSGYYWMDLSQSNAGLDAILFRSDRVIFAEVKDGMKPLSAQKLTPHEQKVHAKLLAHGITVEVLTCPDDLLHLSRPQPSRSEEQ